MTETTGRNNGYTRYIYMSLIINISEYEKVLANLVTIVTTLKASPTAKLKLTLHYKEKDWISIYETPDEDALVILALHRIKQDPNQFNVFIDMLQCIKEMDQIVNAIIGGEEVSYYMLVGSCVTR